MDELKASDVKFSLERAKTMPKAMSNASAIDHVSVDGDYEVTIHLSNPCPAFLYILNDTSMKILSEKAVTEAGDTYGEAPIGTGLMTTLMDLLQPLRLQPGSFRKEVLVQSHWKQGRLM